MQPLSLRLPEGLVAEVDDCARRLQEQTPLLEITRTDALRYLIQLGLSEFGRKGARKRARS